MRRAVSQIGSDAGAMIPESMMLEFVQASSGGKGPDVYRELCAHLDGQVTLAVLGQNLTTEVSGGSFAAANVHDRVRTDIMRSDARQLAATLNRDLIRPMIDLNLGPQAAYPRLVIGLPDEWGREKIESVGAMVDRGLEVPQEVIRRKLGIPDPESDQKRLHPAGAPVPDSDRAAGVACAACGATAAARAEGAPARDAMEALTDEALEDWEEWTRPLVAPVENLLAESRDLKEFRARLIEALTEMKTEEIADLLARAGFSARAAGAGGAPVARD